MVQVLFARRPTEATTANPWWMRWRAPLGRAARGQTSRGWSGHSRPRAHGSAAGARAVAGRRDVGGSSFLPVSFRPGSATSHTYDALDDIATQLGSRAIGAPMTDLLVRLLPPFFTASLFLTA